MKKLLLPILLLAGFSSFAQCNLNQLLTASNTQYLDNQEVLQRSVDENSSIEITPTQILITPGSGNVMTGKITASTCNWTIPFKIGTSSFLADFAHEDGSVLHTSILIEGVDGKITFTLDVKEMENRKIRVLADSFTEKK